jgi:hypothetical protein
MEFSEETQFEPDFYENGIIRPESICKLLSELNFNEIIIDLERDSYSQDKWRKHFPVVALLKLLAVKSFRRQSYLQVVTSLTDEECRLLSLPYDPETKSYLRPSKSTLHYFASSRVGKNGVIKLMKFLAEKIMRLIPNGEGIIDSTPLEASRYSKCSKFNPHYKIYMDKAHIFHYENSVLFMEFSNATEHDEKHSYSLLKSVEEIKPNITKFSLDAGYKSFDTHADAWYILGVHPIITLPENATYHEEATSKKIDELVNKMWKKGGDVHSKMQDKLRFLYENGHKKIVGKYLRNKNMDDPEFNKKLKSRSNCERKHAHIKKTVKFDVKGYQEDNREFNVLLNFVAFQILDLARIQSGMEKSRFSRYY